MFVRGLFLSLDEIVADKLSLLKLNLVYRYRTFVSFKKSISLVSILRCLVEFLVRFVCMCVCDVVVIIAVVAVLY